MDHPPAVSARLLAVLVLALVFAGEVGAAARKPLVTFSAADGSPLSQT